MLFIYNALDFYLKALYKMLCFAEKNPDGFREAVLVH